MANFLAGMVLGGAMAFSFSLPVAQKGWSITRHPATGRRLIRLGQGLIVIAILVGLVTDGFSDWTPFIGGSIDDAMAKLATAFVLPAFIVFLFRALQMDWRLRKELGKDGYKRYREAERENDHQPGDW